MSNSSELNAICYLDALKQLLKQRGITYSHLADELQCSLPTIKRWLNKPGLPLDRLLQMAEVANLEFDEICRLANQLRPQHYIFTDEQDALFAACPELLAYFEELIAGKSPKDIAIEHNLDVRSSGLYLKHLQAVGLIKRKPRNQVQLLVQPPFGFGPGSAYLKQEMQSFMSSIVTEVIHADDFDEDNYAILKPLSLNRQDYLAFVEGITRLIDRYSTLSERRTAPDDTTPWQVAIACGRAPQPKLTRLPQIDT